MTNIASKTFGARTVPLRSEWTNRATVVSFAGCRSSRCRLINAVIHCRCDQSSLWYSLPLLFLVESILLVFILFAFLVYYPNRWETGVAYGGNPSSLLTLLFHRFKK